MFCEAQRTTYAAKCKTLVKKTIPSKEISNIMGVVYLRILSVTPCLKSYLHSSGCSNERRDETYSN
jgi:hypothetical protein